MTKLCSDCNMVLAVVVDDLDQKKVIKFEVLPE